MAQSKRSYHCHFLLCLLLGALILSQVSNADDHDHDHDHHDDEHHEHHHRREIHQASLTVDASNARQIPRNFFGIFFEEINHAGAGGLWAELVNNRGFEAGGRHTPSVISPWGVIGDERVISVTTELSSCFRTNPVALRMDVLCDQRSCPPGGVGVYNPGYWGMNIEEGKAYRVIFFVRSTRRLDGLVSLVNADGTQVLGYEHVMAEAEKVKNWTRMDVTVKATGSHPNSRLQFTTTQNGTIWLDQVSAMPTDTYKGHGFRADMMQMLLNLKPTFLRFPGGCYVEGNWLTNAFRWKETVGPWEERPGHLGDVWNYWSDDGLGYLEYLQLAEDLNAEPVWVINSGIGLADEVDTSLITPFVQEMLDSIEFARGSPESKWGSLRARMGHPKPFSLKYIAIGNENCGRKNYRGNYLKFYAALKRAYPDIKAISNCDASKQELDHPADLYDYHNYTSAEGMLHNTRLFEKTSRHNPHKPKAFVSEYAVTDPREKVINGTFKGALAEAAFLMSLEKNSDVVEMVSYAPLFVNQNDRKWSPDAIVFNSNKLYGISSYWVQTFFKESSGALLLKAHLNTHQDDHIYASAISWHNHRDKRNYITIKVVNFQKRSLNLNISIDGLESKSMMRVLRETVLTSDDLEAENSFDNPSRIVPQTNMLKSEGKEMVEVVVQPYSFTAIDLISNAKNFNIPKPKPRQNP